MNTNNPIDEDKEKQYIEENSSIVAKYLNYNIIEPNFFMAFG